MEDAILQALRIRGRASADALVDVHGEGARAALSALVDRGEAVEGRFGFSLSEAGKGRAAALFAADQGRLGTQAAPLYDAFCEVNGDVKQIVTDWQLRTIDGVATPNDHTDPAHDADVIARLHRAHERVVPTLDALGAVIGRYDGYRGRLEAALAQVDGGDPSFIAAPMQDSYHTVWFELHEDLILATGRSRAEEAAAGRG